MTDKQKIKIIKDNWESDCDGDEGFEDNETCFCYSCAVKFLIDKVKTLEDENYDLAKGRAGI